MSTGAPQPHGPTITAGQRMLLSARRTFGEDYTATLLVAFRERLSVALPDLMRIDNIRKGRPPRCWIFEDPVIDELHQMAAEEA